MVVFDNFFADCPSGQLYLNFSFSKFSKHFSLKEDNISATPCWSWQHLVCKLWLWIMFCKFSFLLTSSAKCRFGHFFVSCRCGSFFVANLLLWNIFLQLILLSVRQDNFFTNVFPDRLSGLSNVKVVQVEEEENFARKYREARGGDYTKLWLLHLVVLKTVILARLFAKKVKGTQINQNNKLK